MDARGHDVADLVRPAATKRDAVIRLDPLGGAAVRAAAIAVAQQLLPLLECEMLPVRSRTALVAGDADVGASALQISQAPLLVVVEASAWVSCVLPSVSFSLTRAEFIAVLLLIAALVLAALLAVALVPGAVQRPRPIRVLRIRRVALSAR